MNKGIVPSCYPEYQFSIDFFSWRRLLSLSRLLRKNSRLSIPLSTKDVQSNLVFRDKIDSDFCPQRRFDCTSWGYNHLPWNKTKRLLPKSVIAP